MKRLDDWIADHVTRAVASMKLFYALNIVVGVAIIYQHPANIEGWLLVVVSVWFQGVALPPIAKMSQIQGDRMEKVLRETHDVLMAELSEIKAMHESQAEELATLRAINQRLSERHERLVEGLERAANPRVKGGRL